MPLRQVRLHDPAAEVLLTGLTAEYEQRYGPTDVMHDVGADEFDPPDGVFVVLVDGDGHVVAGGGLRRLGADVAEIKRMWTSPAHRRRGHARTVIEALEQLASTRGYARVRLETGPAQPEAQALYRALGYGEVPAYGRYDVALGFERVLPRIGRTDGGPALSPPGTPP